MPGAEIPRPGGRAISETPPVNNTSNRPRRRGLLLFCVAVQTQAFTAPQNNKNAAPKSAALRALFTLGGGDEIRTRGTVTRTAV